MSTQDENLDDVIAALIDFDEDETHVQPEPVVTDKSVYLTPRAAKEITKIKATEDLDENLFLRVAVEGGGCSGLSYKLGFDVKNDEDIVLSSEGLEIIVDPRHMMYLGGIEIDYPDGLDARGFTFNNPNASESCGCGTSFAV